MISISDIFGNKNIDNNTPFLLIYSDNLKKYITLLDTRDDDGASDDDVSYIYRINTRLLEKVFLKNKLNINNFLPSSDLLLFKNDHLTQLLFINKNISILPDDFIALELYNKGTVWEPIGTPGYKSIGLLYNKNDKKPNISIPMISVDYLIKIKHGPFYSFKSISEFKNLSNDMHGYWTIDRNIISEDKDDYFKLINYDGNYLTRVNDQFALSNIHDANQIIKYTINGDLIVKNKCLTNKDGKIKFEKCNNNINRKWTLLDNNIISRKDNKCMTLDKNNNFILEKCSKTNDYQQFTKENSDYKKTQHTDYSWKKKGHSVTLINNPNPWYLDKKLDIPKEKYSTELENFKYNNKHKKNKIVGFSQNLNNDFAKYNSKFKNIERFDEKLIEEFSDDLNNNIYLLCILLIVIGTICYIYKNKSKLLKIN